MLQQQRQRQEMQMLLLHHSRNSSATRCASAHTCKVSKAPPMTASAVSVVMKVGCMTCPACCEDNWSSRMPRMQQDPCAYRALCCCLPKMDVMDTAGEVNQRGNSIATFKQTNQMLEQELEELQKQRVSPDATTPSFVAKQRKSIALAETKAEKAQQQITELMQENMALAQQVAELKSFKVAGGDSASQADVVAAAEQLMLGRDSITVGNKQPAAATGVAAAEKAWQQVAELKQEKMRLSEQVDDLRAKLAAYISTGPQEQQEQGVEWKLQEIERLQNDNRLLQQKVRPWD